MKILFFCPGYSTDRRHLQPWKYFDKIAHHLAIKGHNIKLATSEMRIRTIYSFEITDTGITIEQRFASTINIYDLIRDEEPELIVSSIGPLSMIRGNPAFTDKHISVGIITFPIYEWMELRRSGIFLLLRELKNTYQHVIGSILVRIFGGTIAKRLDLVIAQSHRNAERLQALGVERTKIAIVPPGVDEIFRIERIIRQNIHPIVTFMGSANPLRGAQDILAIWNQIVDRFDNAELRLLLRPDPGTEYAMRKIIAASNGLDNINIINETLSESDLISQITESDVIIFPFRLVPSEMPVGPLEAIASGCKVIVSDIDGLGELSRYGAQCYPIGNIQHLKDQIVTAIMSRERDHCSRPQDIPGWEETAANLEMIIRNRLIQRELYG